MKYLVIIVFLFFLSTLFAQDKNTQGTASKSANTIDNTPIYDINGKKISFSELQEIMNSKKFGLKPVKDEKGNIKEIRIVEASNSAPISEAASTIENEGAKGVQLPNYDNIIGNDAPVFNKQALDGKNYDLSKLKGKVVVMNFWFIECTPCREEIPYLNKLVDKYKDNDNVVFISVTNNKSASVKKFLEKNTFKYTQLADASNIIHEYNVNVFPTHFVIDKNGKFSLAQIGGQDIEETLDKEIQKILQ